MDRPPVRFVDHTADVGIDVRAPTLEGLFHHAALGMGALLRGEDDAPTPPAPAPSAPASPAGPVQHDESRVEERVISLDADAVAPLLADWLRELLYLHDTAHLDYVRSDFQRLDRAGLGARVGLVPAAPSVREIKGVTYHELRVDEGRDGWEGRVIFDV